jgi:hypothetical protein
MHDVEDFEWIRLLADTLRLLVSLSDAMKWWRARRSRSVPRSLSGRPRR